MNYLIRLFIAASVALLCACSPQDEAPSLNLSPLVMLLTPTLASAITSAEAAIDKALEKPEYAAETAENLAELKVLLGQLKMTNQLLINARAKAENLSELASSAKSIHQVRALIEADIIALKDTNAAAAIRLGVVNELAEFCQLTAQDISQALSPAGF